MCKNRANEQKALGAAAENHLVVGLRQGNGGAAPTTCTHDNDDFSQWAETYPKEKTQTAEELFVFPAKEEQSSKGKPRKKWNS